MPDDLTVRSVRGAECASLVDDLARLRIEVFRAFPYLYDGDLAYERNYLQTYVASPGSVVVVAADGDTIVGASTGIPMRDEGDAFKEPFLNAGIDTNDVFYCGESVLLEAYRGRGLYRKFFEGREEHARALGGFEWCAFCAVDRPREHPLRPAGYIPLDAVWTSFGYVKHPELVAAYAWKDVDAEGETSKAMTFWLKRTETPA